MFIEPHKKLIKIKKTSKVTIKKAPYNKYVGGFFVVRSA